MASPTALSWKWLQRVLGYLKKVPVLGILMKPARDGSCYGFEGRGTMEDQGELVVESITDADWAGCKRTRRSRTSIQLFVGGSMVASFVRSQRSIALSSGESEFIALVGGSAEALYIAECLRFIAKGTVEVSVRSRTDSAARRGIAQRVGCGRIRHIDTGMLWGATGCEGKATFSWNRAGLLQHGGPWNEASPRTADSRNFFTS